MSKKKGTAEKSFKPMYVEGQTQAEFERTVLDNYRIAVMGAGSDPKYKTANRVQIAWNTIKVAKSLLVNESRPTSILRIKNHLKYWESVIHKFVLEAFENRDAEALRLLADLVESRDRTASDDAASMIRYCSTKPHDYIFTFKEILKVHAASQRLKPPFDEAIVKRVRRLIKMLGIRVRAGQ